MMQQRTAQVQWSSMTHVQKPTWEGLKVMWTQNSMKRQCQNMQKSIRWRKQKNTDDSWKVHSCNRRRVRGKITTRFREWTQKCFWGWDQESLLNKGLDVLARLYQRSQCWSSGRGGENVQGSQRSFYHPLWSQERDSPWQWVGPGWGEHVYGWFWWKQHLQGILQWSWGLQLWSIWSMEFPFSVWLVSERKPERRKCRLD